MSIWKQAINLTFTFTFTYEEVERRQNIGGGLTHVTDSVYEFYFELEVQRLKVHTVQRLRQHERMVLFDSLQALTYNDIIRENYYAIFDGIENYEKSVADGLFEELLASYMRVANNEFRKYLTNKLGKKRKLAHRIEILKGKKSAEQAKVVPEKLTVDSLDAVSSGLALPDVESQPSVSSMNKSSAEPSVTQAESSSPQKSSNTNTKKNKGKGGRGKRTCSATSTQRKARKKSDAAEPVYSCPLCSVVYNDKSKVPWIGCDGCDQWFDRTCAGLANDEEWTKYQAEDMKWYCSSCKP
jgi:hypothetical protein